MQTHDFDEQPTIDLSQTPSNETPLPKVCAGDPVLVLGRGIELHPLRNEEEIERACRIWLRALMGTQHDRDLSWARKLVTHRLQAGDLGEIAVVGGKVSRDLVNSDDPPKISAEIRQARSGDQVCVGQLASGAPLDQRVS